MSLVYQPLDAFLLSYFSQLLFLNFLCNFPFISATQYDFCQNPEVSAELVRKGWSRSARFIGLKTS